MDDKKDILWNAQVSSLRSMQDGIKLLKDCLKDLENKVENEGLSGNYSVHHDSLRYAQKIWAACLRLNELKKLQYELEGRDQFGMLNKETKE